MAACLHFLRSVTVSILIGYGLGVGPPGPNLSKDPQLICDATGVNVCGHSFGIGYNVVMKICWRSGNCSPHRVISLLQNQEHRYV